MFKPLLYHHSHLFLNFQWFTMIPLSFSLLNQWLICCITHHPPHNEAFILCIFAVNISAKKKEDLNLNIRLTEKKMEIDSYKKTGFNLRTFTLYDRLSNSTVA